MLDLVVGTLGMSRYLSDRIAHHPNVDFRLHNEVRDVIAEPELEAIVVEDTHTHERSTLAIAPRSSFIGAEPHAQWLGDEVALTTTSTTTTTTTTLPPYVFVCSVSMSSLFNPLHQVGLTDGAEIRMLGNPNVLRSFDLDVTVDYKQWSPTQHLTTTINTFSRNAAVVFTLQYSGGNPVTVSVAEHGKPTACETSFYPLIEPH
jgi:hypothetical protein